MITITVPAGKRGTRKINVYDGHMPFCEMWMNTRRANRARRWAESYVWKNNLYKPKDAPAAWPFVERVGRGFFRMVAPNHIAQKAAEAAEA